MEQREPSQGHLFCRVPEGHTRTGRQTPLRTRLHSALDVAELPNRALCSEVVE